MVRYDYNERMKNMPFERQCTALRGITFMQSDEDYVQKMMAVVSSRNRAILAMPGSVEEKAKAFIEEIREMNRRMNIPDGFEQIKEEDLPVLVQRALKEANPLYPVPKIMNEADCEAVIRRLMK